MNTKNFVPAKFVNLTGVDITVVDLAGQTVVKIPVSGLAYVEYVLSKIGDINGVSVFNKHVKCVTGMPEEKENEVYIVNQEVRAAIWGNPYVVAPYRILDVKSRRNDALAPIVCMGFEQ